MIDLVAISVVLGAVTTSARPCVDFSYQVNLSGAKTNTSEVSYAPYTVKCPSDLKLVREANGLSTSEAEWVQGRKLAVANSITEYLARLDLEGFDLDEYTEKLKESPQENVPVIAWATSGGGWRSAFTGIGGLNAIDERTEGSKEAKVGGLFQSLTYIAGLSGGSWPTMSIALSDYAPISELVKSWHVDVSRMDSEEYTPWTAPLSSFFETIIPKAEAGYNVSAADLLGRLFAYEFVPGVNRTFSSVADLPGFKQFDGPMPLLLSTSVNASSRVVNGLYLPTIWNQLFEWSPFEWGSWDRGFVPTKYVGTVPNKDNTANECVVNYDQASFVLGAVASAYNSWWLLGTTNGTEGGFSKRDNSFSKRDTSIPLGTLEGVNKEFEKIFGYTLDQISLPSIPNPFGGDENITLADNSEAGQAIPFNPLIQRDRKVDFIMAWDDDGDEDPYGWNNGTNIYNTYIHSKEIGLPFPEVPPVKELLALNYTLKPVLFGCDTNLTTTKDASSPIVAYFANAPYSFYSNYSWMAPNMSYHALDGIMKNSFDLLTQGNGTQSSTWTDCLGCAAIDRSLQRMNITRPEVCEKCFAEHCWDGTIGSGVSDDFVLDPVPALDPSLSYAEWAQAYPDLSSA